MSNLVDVIVDLPSSDFLPKIALLRCRAWAADGVLIEASAASEPVDSTANHFGVLALERVVAAIRLTFHSSIADLPLPHDLQSPSAVDAPVAFISRLAVDVEARRRGLAGRLVTHALETAIALGAHSVIAFTTVKKRATHAVSLGFAPTAEAPIIWGGEEQTAQLLVWKQPVT